MKKVLVPLSVLLAAALLAVTVATCSEGADETAETGEAAESTSVISGSTAESAGQEAAIELPAPRKTGAVSLEEAIQGRRSVREYSSEPLSLKDLGQLLWAAQGITSPQGARAAPSAGGIYPLEIYVVAGQVAGLEPAVYRYLPAEHGLAMVGPGDVRQQLRAASLDQAAVGAAAVDVVVAAVYGRTAERYGERATRYVHLEAGHAAQNLCLQAVALSLGAVTIGAFSDKEVRKVIGLSDEEKPLYVIPIGWPAS